MNVHELRGFGAKVAAEAVRERTFAGMTPTAWKQTAKDMPFVIGAGAVGWGVGKTIADAVASRHAGPMVTQGAQYAPMIGNIIGMAASYTAGRMRAELQQRRNEAAKLSGLFPLTAKQRAAGQADFEARSAAREEQNKQRIIGLYMKHGPSLDDSHLEDHEARLATTMTRAEAEKHYNSTPKSPSGG